VDASTDTETSSGNILNALMKFPVVYTFHVVGKTNGDAATQSSFVQQVQRTIQESCGDDDDDDDEPVRYDVTQRGTKYTKVSIQKQVMNAQEITFIYDQLSQLDRSVMQF
jgi:putative lipoic acid-binding regulatory protein